MRNRYSFLPSIDFIDKALQFANHSSHVVYLNPNSYAYPYEAFRHVLAFGAAAELQETTGENFEALKKFLALHRDWAFGYLSYDLKKETEQLASENPDAVGFPLIRFFVPEHLIFFEKEKATIYSRKDPEALKRKIEEEIISGAPATSKIKVQQKISHDEYISKVKKIQAKIREGSIYEMNFCMEYFSENAVIDPLAVYQKLNRISPMPFSAYLKTGNHFLLCASPERFLKKEKQKLVSQPIKGTAKRGKDEAEDLANKNTLAESPKERAENIMIVDLVRNDLSRSAVAGSVIAEEVCKVYTFPNVHQMISTISAELSPEFHPVDSIVHAFPMGSMTGAPKVRAMELIEAFEESRRGLFSGSVGYFTPEMDFDFNVVIRSILYNETSRFLSFQAGSAITYYADPEKEYEECAVKTAAIRKALD